MSLTALIFSLVALVAALAAVGICAYAKGVPHVRISKIELETQDLAEAFEALKANHRRLAARVSMRNARAHRQAATEEEQLDADQPIEVAEPDPEPSESDRLQLSRMLANRG